MALWSRQVSQDILNIMSPQSPIANIKNDKNDTNYGMTILRSKNYNSFCWYFLCILIFIKIFSQIDVPLILAPRGNIPSPSFPWHVTVLISYSLHFTEVQYFTDVYFASICYAFSSWTHRQSLTWAQLHVASITADFVNQYKDVFIPPNCKQ